MKVVILVFIGIPATGKTTLSQHLEAEAVLKDFYFLPVHYEEALPSWKTRETSQGIGHRPQLFNDVSRLIRNLIDKTRNCPNKSKKKLTKKAAVFVIDDNMYLRSMRYPYYQLAKEYSLSFCQVYFDAKLEHALEKNSRRKDPVSFNVIRIMHDKMERPSSLRTWERNSIVVHAYAGIRTNCEKIRDLLEISLLCVPCSKNEPDIRRDYGKLNEALSLVISCKIRDTIDSLSIDDILKLFNKYDEIKNCILSDFEQGLILLPEGDSTAEKILPFAVSLIHNYSFLQKLSTWKRNKVGQP